MRLYIVRHGQSVWNAESRIQGQAPIGLSPAGHVQARQAAERLAGEPITHVISSDLPRAAETAAAIAGLHNLDVEHQTALRERHFGEFQGMTFSQITGEYPEIWSGVFRGDDRPPGGESRGDVSVRVGAFLDALPAERPGAYAVLVTHGGTIRAMLTWLLGMDTAEGWRFRVDNCGLTIVDVYPEGPIIDILNDRSHLTSLDAEPA